MYKEKSILALIPARGGSKGIKNKNIVVLAGKPLLTYTISAAQEAACFDRIVVSTDSDEIARTAKEWGADIPFMRPAELASDEAKSEPVATHALKALEEQGETYDIVVYLQPTSPLRQASHIIGAIDFFIERNLPSLVSVCLVREHPLYMRTMENDGRLKNIVNIKSDVRRQDLSQYYKLNGAIYINNTDDILSCWRGNDNLYGYIMDSISSLDIDSYEDLQFAENKMQTRIFYK